MPIPGNFVVPAVPCANPPSGANTVATMAIVRNPSRLMLPSANILFREYHNQVAPKREFRMQSNSHSRRLTYLKHESKGLPRRLDTLWHSAALRQSPDERRGVRQATHMKLRCCIAPVTRSRGLPRVCAVQRRRSPVGATPTRQPLQPEATGAAMEVTKWLKPSVSVSRYTVTARVCRP